MSNKIPKTINGILNVNWLKEKAKDITPEKGDAILKRNEALRFIPMEKRAKWLKENPIEKFMQ